MSLLALLFVVIAACSHATWNLLAKRAASVGAPFVFAYTAFAVLFYAPAALWALLTFGFEITYLTVFCVIASGILHLAYSLVLQRGYQVADLSIVYPVARGTGPLLSAVGAFFLLGEQVSLSAVLGLFTVVGGVLVLASGGRLGVLADASARPGVAWGGATGGFIAGYTVVDAWGVKILGINPVLLDWFANTARSGFLFPSIWRDRAANRHRMRGYWGIAAGVGALAPLGYILILAALQLGAPLHVVAPAREMSMMVAAFLGMLVLGEPVTRTRIAGCAMIAAGVILLAS